MKAIILEEAGGVENLITAEVEVPKIKDHEVLIKVKAISINPIDVKARSSQQRLIGLLGTDRPWILGWDVSGIVVQTGNKVSAFREGDEVFGMINFPGHGKAYAEYVAAPDTHIAIKPANISHEEAAATCLAALTAWQSILSAEVKANDKVLIHAAAGGVGHFAVQMAKHLGAYVIGTASAKNQDFIETLGADAFINYETTPLEKATGNIDFVLDTIGNDVYHKSLNVIRSGGTIISLPEPISEKQLRETQSKNIKGYRVIVGSEGEHMKQLATLLATGAIKPFIAHSFPFSKLREAHLQLETGRTKGKVVVVLPE